MIGFILSRDIRSLATTIETRKYFVSHIITRILLYSCRPWSLVQTVQASTYETSVRMTSRLYKLLHMTSRLCKLLPMTSSNCED